MYTVADMFAIAVPPFPLSTLGVVHTSLLHSWLLACFTACLLCAMCQDGCTNATEAAARGIDVSDLSPAKLCWPAKVLLVDTTVASAVINTTTNATVPTNYIIRQFNTQ